MLPANAITPLWISNVQRKPRKSFCGNFSGLMSDGIENRNRANVQQFGGGQGLRSPCRAGDQRTFSSW
jgi:hypothetical protein